MSAQVDIVEFATPRQASDALADRVAADLQNALAQHGGASLVVSGGSSPARMLQRLGQASLDWSNVWVVPSDERQVPVDHPDSNAGMIGRTLLQGPAAAASLLSLLPDALGSLDAVAERLSRLTLPFAHTVLGMGADGHTASLFPTAAEIDRALVSPDRVLPLEVPGMASGRISLTPRALLESRAVSLLLFGDEKRRVLEAALEPGPVRDLPVRAVLHNDRCPVCIYWAPQETSS